MPNRVRPSDTEFLFAKPLVDADFLVRLATAGLAENLGRLDRANIGRGEHDLGSAIFLSGREPLAKRARLLHPELRQRHVDIAVIELDTLGTGGIGGVARNIARALAVADDP